MQAVTVISQRGAAYPWLQPLERFLALLLADPISLHAHLPQNYFLRMSGRSRADQSRLTVPRLDAGRGINSGARETRFSLRGFCLMFVFSCFFR